MLIDDDGSDVGELFLGLRPFVNVLECRSWVFLHARYFGMC